MLLPPTPTTQEKLENFHISLGLESHPEFLIMSKTLERNEAREDLRRDDARENDEKLTDYFLIRKGKVNVCKLESN